MTKYRNQAGKIYEIDCVDDPLTYSEEIDDLKGNGYHIENRDSHDDCLSDNLYEIIENLSVQDKFALTVVMEDYRQKNCDTEYTPSVAFDINDCLERYGLEYDLLSDKLGNDYIDKNYYLLYPASKDFDKEDFAEFLDEDLTDWLTSLPYSYDYAEAILDFLQKRIKGFRYWNVTGYVQGDQAYVWINDEDNDDPYTADELSGLLFGNIYSVWDPEQEDTLEEFWGWEDTQKYIDDNHLKIAIQQKFTTKLRILEKGEENEYR